MARTAFFYDPLFMQHDTGPGHPESARRLSAILDRLTRDGILDRCCRPDCREAPVDAVTRVHTPEHVERIRDLSAIGRHFYEGPDTAGSSATYRAALTAAGAAMAAADMVMAGEAANAFCAVRPPGHHAEAAAAMGFCFFNNAAICVRHLQEAHAIRRVAVIDWDVHHGNGTQNAFYEDSTVFYASIHQFPHYPGSGRGSETGAGAGKGTTLNMPMGPGSTETDYLRAFNETLVPAINLFKPEFIVISAGFDAHEFDPLSSIALQSSSFGKLTEIVLRLASAHCSGRIVSLLEGGYHPEALPESVASHLTALLA